MLEFYLHLIRFSFHEARVILPPINPSILLLFLEPGECNKSEFMANRLWPANEEKLCYALIEDGLEKNNLDSPWNLFKCN
jgi:hypothetical protein